jgi:hypothetical protein
VREPPDAADHLESVLLEICQHITGGRSRGIMAEYFLPTSGRLEMRCESGSKLVLALLSDRLRMVTDHARLVLDARFL